MAESDTSLISTLAPGSSASLTGNNTAQYEINFFQNILELLPWCSTPPALQHTLFQAAHVLFLVAYTCPPTRYGMLAMHGILVAGFLTYSTWAWNIACARDVFSWGFAFALLNLGQSLHVLYQNRPVRTDKELETVYKNLFRPLNVERLVFQRLMSSDTCHVTSLHAGEAYAMQGLTPTDRLGLLLTGKVNVLSGGQLLHSISPLEFLDSPEFESSRAATEDKFQVSIVAATTSRFLFWKRSSLEFLFMKDQHLATVLSTLVAKDITAKLYNMNSRIVTGSGSHLDIRLPSLTSSLNTCLLGGGHPMPAPSLSSTQRGLERGDAVAPKLQVQERGVALGLSPQVGGQFGVPFGYSNDSRNETSLSNGGVAPLNKMEHPLH